MSRPVKGASGRVVNKLTDRAKFALTKLVGEAYEAGRTGVDDDAKFAEFATAQLGFLVTAGNVQGSREVLDIPGARTAGARSQNAEIAELQRRVERLEQRVQVYLDGCCKDRPAGGGAP